MMKSTHAVLFAAALSAGLTIASSQTHAAGPMVAVGALAASSAGSAVAILSLLLSSSAGARSSSCGGLFADVP